MMSRLFLVAMLVSLLSCAPSWAQKGKKKGLLQGTVTEVKTDGLMAQVEIVVNEPVRLVALITRDAVEEIGLKPGMATTAIVKSTNVMVQSW